MRGGAVGGLGAFDGAAAGMLPGTILLFHSQLILT
jgi:hypothetical protein